MLSSPYNPTHTTQENDLAFASARSNNEDDHHHPDESDHPNSGCIYRSLNYDEHYPSNCSSASINHKPSNSNLHGNGVGRVQDGEGLSIPLLIEASPETRQRRWQPQTQLRNQIRHFYLSLHCQYLLVATNFCILIVMASLVVVDIWDLSQNQSNDLLSQTFTRVIDWTVTIVLTLEIFLRFIASQSPSNWSVIRSLTLDLVVLAGSIASLVVAYAVDLGSSTREEFAALLFFLRIVRDAIRLSLALYFLRQLHETTVDFDRLIQSQSSTDRNNSQEWKNEDVCFEEFGNPTSSSSSSPSRQLPNHSTKANSISTAASSSITTGREPPSRSTFNQYTSIYQHHHNNNSNGSNVNHVNHPSHRVEHDKSNEVMMNHNSLHDSNFYSVDSSQFSRTAYLSQYRQSGDASGDGNTSQVYYSYNNDHHNNNILDAPPLTQFPRRLTHDVSNPEFVVLQQE